MQVVVGLCSNINYAVYMVQHGQEQESQVQHKASKMTLLTNVARS